MNFYRLTAFFLLVSSCNSSTVSEPLKDNLVKSNSVIDTTSNKLNKSIFYQFTLDDFYEKSEALSLKVDSIYLNLSLKERAAQLIMPATSEYYKIGIPYESIKEAVYKRQIGGVLYLKGTKKKFKEYIEDLNKISNRNNSLPLINSCDCEPTLYHRKFKDADSVASANLLVNTELIDSAASKISREIKAMGIQINFAPVADIAINEEIINTRSFSKKPVEIIERSNRFIAVSQALNIATTIKHFPGHGAIKGDSHKELVFVDSTLSEVGTFERIINESNPIAVMIGHIAIKNNINYDTHTPSSLSRKVITGLLKNKIGFKGIVVTDAMQMKSVLKIQNASWKALVAGADLVVMPINIETLHTQIVNELNVSNSFLAKQFEVSIKKIIRLKICTGVIK